MIRRVADIAIALVALIALSPLFVVASVAIIVESPGSPFYGGWRAGKDGVRFRMWKLRTMISGADKIGGSITRTSRPENYHRWPVSPSNQDRRTSPVFQPTSR